MDYEDSPEQKQDAALDILFPTPGNVLLAALDKATMVDEVEIPAAPDERKNKLVCDCSKKVPLTGKSGVDYLILNIGSPKLTRSWHIHNRKDCYAEVSKKIREAHD